MAMRPFQRVLSVEVQLLDYLAPTLCGASLARRQARWDLRGTGWWMMLGK